MRTRRWNTLGELRQSLIEDHKAAPVRQPAFLVANAQVEKRTQCAICGAEPRPRGAVHPDSPAVCERGNHALLVPDVLGDGWAPESARANMGSRCACGLVRLQYGLFRTASRRH
jgi:hypothetical protein